MAIESLPAAFEKAPMATALLKAVALDQIAVAPSPVALAVEPNAEV